ncbi:MAG TPA: hypothetical protein PKN52_00075 [Trueperaceae bacterium]|nr:hypothetical protein [Trueperaceae bacterium]
MSRERAQEALRWSPLGSRPGSLYALPQAERRDLLEALWAELGLTARLTRGRPAYATRPGTHTLVRTLDGWWNVLGLERLAEEDHRLVVAVLTDLRHGEYTIYG